MADKKITSIWQLDEFKALEPLYTARKMRLLHGEMYYEGKMYSGNAEFKAWPLQAVMGRTRKQIRVLFQPLAGAVHIDVALTPGGWQLDDDSQRHADAVKRILKMSRWKLEQDMYVHTGASMGQATLKVIDNWETKTVTIQPIRPDSVLPVQAGAYDQRLKMAIIIGTTTGPDGKPAELAEVITPEMVTTYVAGHLAGVDGRKSSFPNALGEVPIIDAPFIYTGAAMGETTYEAARQPLDGVNEQASNLEMQIDRHIEPQWAAMVEDPERNAADLVKSGDNVWWFPTGSNIQALVAALDIGGVLEFIKEIKSDIKDTLPETLIFELVGMNRIAVPAVEIQLLPLTTKIHRIRRSMDDGLARALRLAGRAYGMMKGEPAFAALDDVLLDFDEHRPVVFMDALSALSLEQNKLAVDATRLSVQQMQQLEGDGRADE